MLFCGVCFGAVVTESFLSPDGVTVEKLDSNRLALTNAANSLDGGLLQNESVTAGKLDANATPVNRWNESFNDFVYTGLIVPTSDDLDATTTAGTAYIKGTRVVKDATPHTYSASLHTYVDLSNNGTYTYSEVATGGAAPSVALNSIRLMIISTDATKVSIVSDERTTTVTLGTSSAISLVDTDQDTQIQVEESNDEDKIRFDTGGTERAVIDSTGLTLQNGTFVDEFSTDGTLAGNSDTAVPTEKATKTYVDALKTYVDALSVSVFVGEFTRDTTTATGSQAVTGVGFVPKAVIFFAAQDGATGEFSVGMDDGTRKMVISDQYNTVANTYVPSSTYSILDTDTGANRYQGSISSLDSNGFTIAWVRASSPTGTLNIKFLAIR